jgi:predicted dehydrogenase
MNSSPSRATTTLAFIGLGRQGQRHLACAHRLRESEQIEIVAAVDVDPLCAGIAAEFGVPFYGDVRELPSGVDACVVATPTTAHMAVGELLLDRGIDLLIEKPVASSLAQTRALVQRAESRNCVLQVGYLERYHPSFASVHPDFSRPTQIVSERSTKGASIRTMPDLVRELMIHDLDIIATWLDGAPLEASWRNAREGKNDAEGTLDLVFEGGHRVSLFAQSGAPTTVRRTVVKSDARCWQFAWGNSDAPTWNGPDQVSDDPITLQLRAFIRAVRSRAAPYINGKSALKAMQLAERAIRALPTGA